MATVTLIGRVRKKLIKFKYNGVTFGARRISSGWLMFADGEFIGKAEYFPFQFAYDWLLKQ